MYVLDGVTWQPLDSARIENSAFRIASNNKGSGIGILYMGPTSNPADLTQTGYYMFLENGTISTQADSTYEYVYRGTPMNDTYTEFQQFRETATTDQQRNKLRELVRQNHNVLGCYLLHDLLDLASKTEVEQLMDSFPEALKQHPLFRQVKARTDAIRADVGLPYLDLTAQDTAGADASLGETVHRPGNRYVLLEFWATWCGPCVQAVPHLKELYARYHSKGFDIYGYSFTHGREAWKAFVARNGMAWTNVHPHFEGNPRTACPAWAAYGLNGIPSNFLIDTASGLIIAKNLQGKELDNYLAQLLP